MKKSIILIIFALLLLIGFVSIRLLSQKDKAYPITLIENVSPEGYKSFMDYSMAINHFSILDYDYKVLSQTGNEAVYNVEFNQLDLTRTQICVYSDAPTKEIKEISYNEETNITLERSYNYTIPNTLSLYKTDKLVKSDNLNITIEKSNSKSKIPTFETGDKLKFCYIADKTKDTYLKFGDNSIIVILEANIISDSVLVNVTAETGANNFTHLNITNTAPYNNLIFYLPFDGDVANTVGTTAYDFSNQNNNGIYNGSAFSNTTGCVYGSCAKIDSNSEFVNIADNPTLDLPDGNWAVSMWLKLDGNAGTSFSYVFAVGTSTDGPYILWYIPQASYTTTAIRNKLSFEGRDDDGTLLPFNSSSIDVGASTSWQYIILQREGTTYSQYVNGVLSGTRTVAAFDTVSAATGMSFGNRGFDGIRPINGSIDEVMLFNTNLDSSQIQGIYKNQSIRFLNTGLQELSNQTYLNISSGNNRVNVSTTFDALFGSSVNLTVGYYNDTDWFYTPSQVLTSGVNATFNISGVSTNLTLNYTLIAGNSSNPFYTPIIHGDIIYEVWNVAEGADTTAPYFTTIPSTKEMNYTQGLGVQFEADDETLLDSYSINWTTLFTINSSGYLKNSTSNIAVGKYHINVTINDSSNNLNSTIYIVNVSKATSVNCGLFVNPGATVTYPTANKFQTINPGDPGDADIDLNLYRDGVEISNPDNTILGVGAYDYISNMTGGQNWTDKASCGGTTFTVNQATGIVNGTINGTQGNFTAINGTATQNIWINATNKTGYGSGSIYLNGTLINSGTMPLSNLTNFSIGFYNITFIYDGNTNYSSDEEVWWVNISEIISDTTPPTWVNLRNFTHTVNTSFSQSITATDLSGIGSYWLNDTTYFIINISTGLITNSTNLSRIETHNLNISVNDTLGNLNSGIFWINITMPSPPSNVTYSAINQCKYKKFGYYNLKLPWFKESGCL